jgi:hypothetical protein
VPTGANKHSKNVPVGAINLIGRFGMVTILNRKEVLYTTDYNKYRNAIDALKMHGIEYELSVYRPSENFDRRSYVGEYSPTSEQYMIYVKSKDLEKAHFLINSVH